MIKYTPKPEIVKALNRPISGYGYAKTLNLGDYSAQSHFRRFYPIMTAFFSEEMLNSVPVNGIMYPSRLFNVETA